MSQLTFRRNDQTVSVDDANPLPTTASIAGDVTLAPGTKLALADDAAVGRLKVIRITLSATADVVTRVDVPDNARGFVITALAANARFAVGENVTAFATAPGTDQLITVDQLAVGNLARADQSQSRLLPDGTGRFITIASTNVSMNVDVEFF